MITLKKTTGLNSDFIHLCRNLDTFLTERHNDTAPLCKPFNDTNSIKHAIVAYNENNDAIGCGAIRAYTNDTMEIKRIFVDPKERGKHIAMRILSELENLAVSLGANKCILETGNLLTESINLYKKANYQTIPNYGVYKNMESSVCFEKDLV